MPFGPAGNRTAVFYDKEILKYPTGLEAIKNLVIDSSTVSANGDGRLIIEAGTVISKINASSKVKPAPTSGLAEADVVGILAHTLELFGTTDTDFDVPGAAFFHGCVFDTTKLLSYSSNAANVKAALKTC